MVNALNLQIAMRRSRLGLPEIPVSFPSQKQAMITYKIEFPVFVLKFGFQVLKPGSLNRFRCTLEIRLLNSFQGSNFRMSGFERRRSGRHLSLSVVARQNPLPTWRFRLCSAAILAVIERTDVAGRFRGKLTQNCARKGRVSGVIVVDDGECFRHDQ